MKVLLFKSAKIILKYSNQEKLLKYFTPLRAGKWTLSLSKTKAKTWPNLKILGNKLQEINDSQQTIEEVEQDHSRVTDMVFQSKGLPNHQNCFHTIIAAMFLFKLITVFFKR